MMFRLLLFFAIAGSVNNSFAQDSLEVIECFNRSDFESKACEFEGNYIVTKAIIGDKYIQIDSIETRDPKAIAGILKFDDIEFILKMDVNEVKCQQTEGRHNYYKCYSLDTVSFCKIAFISIPLEGSNTDSIYEKVEKDLSNGISWNKLNIHPSCPDPSKMSEIRGQQEWVQEGYYVSEIENAIINLELGKTTLVKVPQYHMAYIVLKTNEIQKSEVRKIKLISVED